MAVETNLGWDNYGNVTKSRKGGSSTACVYTNTAYVYRDAVPTAYIVDKPKQVWVSSTTSGTPTLEEKWFAYDQGTVGQLTRGNVSTVYSWLDQVIATGLPTGAACPAGGHGTGGSCVATHMVYDNDSSAGYGNLTVTIDAKNRTTTTTYDSDTQIYPYIVTNPLLQHVATTYDVGCGALLTQTVPYPSAGSPSGQPQTQYAYDVFCRPWKVALPDETLADPHRIITYYLGSPGYPTDVWTKEVEPWMASPFGAYVKRDDFLDGLGRSLQMQHDAVVGGALTLVASGTVRFDTVGNVDLRYSAFTTTTATGPGGIALLQRAPVSAGTTEYQYDPIHRVTRVTNPDTTYRLIDYTIPWQTTTKDECYTAANPSCPGSKAVERRDAFGRVVEKQLYKIDTFETRTGYTYDVLGRLTEIKQGKTTTTWQTASPDTRVTNTYDSLGRKIQTIDPDSGTTAPGTWKYGYDLIGNLVYQDDPAASQSLLFLYDAFSRVTRKVYRGSDVYCDPAQPSCTGTGQKIEYSYDTQGGAALTCLSDVCPSGVCALGRLTGVTEYTVANPTTPSNTTAVCYDVRGRRRQVATTLAVTGSLPLSGETRYTYDRADHVLTMRYPDEQETVNYTYDAVGQVVAMDGTNSSGQPVVYLLNQTYDRFGRPLQVLHSNNVTDTFTYYETSENYRLQQIDTKLGSTSLQKLTYDQYHDNGLIRHVTDGVYAPASPLSNTAQFDYDGLGRLRQVSGGTTGFNGTYAEGDNLQNLTSKDGTTLTYSTTAPHRVANAAGGAAPYGAVGYDANGNRSSIAAPARTYTYTADNRLAQVTGAGVSLSFVYDSTGHRTAKIVNPGASQQVTWYFGDLMEVSDRFVTKYYFAAGRRIASQRYWRPVGFLAMNEPAVRVAGLPAGHGLMLVLTLRRDVQIGAGLTALLAVTLLCALPGRRRKAVVGVALRRGHVVLVLLVFAASAVPVPILVRPAGAQSPTPTPVGGDTLGIMHYHLDHLGSTQVITTQTGSVFRHLRYTAYGAVRGPWNASGASASGCGTHEYCHEFTGYDTEPLTNLQYASARFYDPGLGMFLSHDPAREFASPYAYVGWDPVNGADPHGMCVWDLCLDVILIGVIAGFAASSIQAAVNGASAGEALKAGVIGAAIGGASAGVGAGILQPALKGVIAVAFGASASAGDVAAGILITSSLGQAAYGLSQGDYSGIIGLGVSLGVAYAISQGAQPVEAEDVQGTSTTGRDGPGKPGNSDPLHATYDDVVQSIKELEEHREALRFEGLSPEQVGFDPNLPANNGHTDCGLFGSCHVTISETFTDRAELNVTLWHESVHVHRGWLGRLYSLPHSRLIGYDGEVLNAFRTGDFGGLNLPATRNGGLDLSVPQGVERRGR